MSARNMRGIVLGTFLAGAVGFFIFFHYGGAVWRPYAMRITGGKTVEEVVENLKTRGLGIEAGLLESLEGLVLLGLKEEEVLEVWGKRRGESPIRIKEYAFTGSSGTLGPKLREGDRQIPEGIYSIEYLNPNSRFHLSMKLDYPNAFDRAKGRADGRDRLGFDIFIHGESSTIGCIPIGNEGIEELFLLVSEIGEENVVTILAPYDMRVKSKKVEVDGITWLPELYEEIRAAIARELAVVTAAQ
jgi:hypothetical protein